MESAVFQPALLDDQPFETEYRLPYGSFGPEDE